jgi:hypothetical protein
VDPLSDFFAFLVNLSPLWALLVYIGGMVLAGHWSTKRVQDDDVRSDLSDSGSKLLGATATGLFVLIGFTVAMLWSVLQAELSAINDEVESAAKIAATSYLLEPQAQQRIEASLIQYLEVASSSDRLILEQGDVPVLPSTAALTDLLQEVNSAANYDASDEWIQQHADDLVGELAANRASVRSIANREMPASLRAVLLIASGVVAMFAGASMAVHRKPYLVVGWVVSLSLALSLAFWLNNPFAGPMAANLEGLAQLADHLKHPDS